MQVQLHLVLAGGADRPGGHAHFAACNRVPRLYCGLGDVRRADGSEQLAFGAGLGLELELEVLELGGARLRRRKLFVGLRFELVALGFELRDVGGSRHRRPARGHQKISRVARFHLDPIADLPEVRDLLQQYDFHVLRPAD